jgi:alkyl hydroperoxide reductase subunit AhpC
MVVKKVVFSPSKEDRRKRDVRSHDVTRDTLESQLTHDGSQRHNSINNRVLVSFTLFSPENHDLSKQADLLDNQKNAVFALQS